jgi:hypothetical protein
LDELRGTSARNGGGNPDPSLQSKKVQRLLEYGDILNNQQERPTSL